MPYQKIGTPVFWVDTLQYLQAMGVGGPGALTSYSEEIDGSNIFSINPASYPKKISPYDAGNGSYRRYYRWFSENLAEPIDSVSDFHPNSTSSTQSMPDIQLGSLDYVAILNHNLASTGFNKVLSALVSWGEDLDSIETALHGQNSSMIPYINYETDSTVIADGFSFFEIDVMDIAAHYFVLNFRSDEGFAFNENDFISSLAITIFVLSSLFGWKIKGSCPPLVLCITEVKKLLSFNMFLANCTLSLTV